MIIKRKRLKKYQPNGYSEVEDIVKNSPGFHSTSTSYESYKTFSDDDRDMQDLKNLAVGGGLGVGAGALIGKRLGKSLDRKSINAAKKGYNEERRKYRDSVKGSIGTTEKEIRDSYKKRIDSIKEDIEKRKNKNTGFKKFFEKIDNYFGKQELKTDLEALNKKIKDAEVSRDIDLNNLKAQVDGLKRVEKSGKDAVTEKLKNKLKRNRRIGLGVGIGSAAALGGLGLYGMNKHNQEKRNSGEKRSPEKSSIEEALGRSSEEVASGKRDPRFHNFHNLPKEKREEQPSIIPTKGSIINSLKSRDPEELKEKFHKFRNTVANVALVRNIGNGLKDGFSGLSDNIKHNLFGNDK